MEKNRKTNQKYLWGIILLPALIIIVLWFKQTPKIELTLDEDAPPIPAFETPVDYVAWVRSRNFEDGSPCGEEVYPSLFQKELSDLFKLDEGLRKALYTSSEGPWSKQEIPELDQYLVKLEPYLTEFVKGTKVKNIQWLCNAKGLWEGPHPNYSASRILAKALLASAWANNPEYNQYSSEIVGAIESNFQHAKHLQQSSISIAHLTSIGIRSINYKAIRSGFQNSYLSNEHASQILEILHNRDHPADIVEAFRGDWAGLLDMMQILYPNGKFSNSAAKSLELDNYLLGGFFLPSPYKTVAQLSNWFQTAIDLITSSNSITVYHNLRKHGATREEVSGRNLILSTLLPSFSMQYLLDTATETKRRGTIIFVTLHKYYHERHRWPSTLSELELTPSEIRIDPYSEQEFKYAIRDGNPWLYSVGLDGLDNNGKHDPRTMTSDRKEGYDYVFMPIPSSP